MPTITINGHSREVSEEQHREIMGIVHNQDIPSDGDQYHFITSCGKIGTRTWDNGSYDNMRLAMGNVYLSKSEAKAARDEIKAQVAAG